MLHRINVHKHKVAQKITSPSHLLGTFCAVSQSQCHSTAPSTQPKNHSKICDPPFNIYCRTGSNGSKVAVRFIRNITSQQITAYIHMLWNLKYLFRKYSLKHFPDFTVVTDAVKLSKGNFPAVIMNWVQGQTLISFLKHNIRHTRQLHLLLEEFVEVCRQNHVADIVHNDLHSGNIIVGNDGKLLIIDIDNAWHLTFGQVKDPAGNCDYQHPMRRVNKYFAKYIDYFSEIIISATIYVAIHAPALFNKYCDDESLFTEKDCLTPNASPLISELSKNSSTVSMASLIIDLCHEKNLENIPPVETIDLFCQ